MMVPNRKAKIDFLISAFLLLLFSIFTFLVSTLDVGVSDTGVTVGFSSVNLPFFRAFPANRILYVLSEVLGYVALALAFSFAVLGVLQWKKRGKLSLVDKDLFLLGVLYIITIFFYVLFLLKFISARPVALVGAAENSYPSSHTVLAVTVFSSGYLTLGRRLSARRSRQVFLVFFVLCTVTVAARLFSGMHWLTDVVGGVLLSASLSFLYAGGLHCLPEFPKRG